MKRVNKRGSVLISTVSTILLVFVILGICLLVANGYQQRSINEHARKQAYLNGLSVAQAVAGQIGNNISLDKYIPANASSVVEYNVASMPNNIGGNASIKILFDSKSEDIIYIQVTSKYNKSTEQVQVTMQKYQSKWYLKTYSKIGDEFSA